MENNLLKTIPNVLRARGFRLYLANGKRLVDLWQNNGAAVLGHTPLNILRELKNTASRGLYAPFPHFTENRLIKALSKLLPERNFFLYAAPPQELIALFENGSAKLWRPFVDPTAPFSFNDEIPYLVPVLPGIQLWRGGLPFGLCITAASLKVQSPPLPRSDMLSPVLLAIAARGVHDILAASERANPQFPRISKVIERQGCAHTPCKYTECLYVKQSNSWKREGIYLTPKENLNSGEWAVLFNKFYEGGFLLPPDRLQPVILPGELSEGEEEKLAVLLNFSFIKI